MAGALPANLETMPAQPHLKRIVEGRRTLTREAAHALMQQSLRGELSEIQLAGLPGALAARGETAAAVAGFVEATRAAAVPFPLADDERRQLVDTCGTGG